MGIKICLSIFAWIVFFIHDVSAQKFMILQRGANEKTRIRYEEGDFITYQQRGLDYFITDQIVEIQSDFLVLKENIIRPEDILKMDIRNVDERNRTLRNLTLLPAAAGVMLLTAETINSLYQEGSISYNSGSLVVAGGLFVSSFILSKVRYRYFRNKGRNKIQIIYLEERILNEIDEN